MFRLFVPFSRQAVVAVALFAWSAAFCEESLAAAPAPAETKWAQQYFSAAREPRISGRRKADQPDTYRFLWLREASQPVVVRIAKAKPGAPGALVCVVRLTGNADGEPGRVSSRDEFTVGDREWRRFLRLAEESAFWTVSTKDPIQPEPIGGSLWVLEGAASSRYQLVERYSPRWAPQSRVKSDPMIGAYADACGYLLRLSRLPLHKAEIF